MNIKNTPRKKGAIVVVSGMTLAALALSGTTTALWNDNTNIQGATITAGNLDIDKIGTTTWQDISPDAVDVQTGSFGELIGEPIDLNTYRIVPKDVILGYQNIDVALEGDNMAANFTIVENSLSSGDLLNERQGVGVEYRIYDVNANQPVTEWASLETDGLVKNITQSNVSGITLDGKTDYRVEIKATFDENTPLQVRTQARAQLADLGVSVKQVRNNDLLYPYGDTMPANTSVWTWDAPEVTDYISWAKNNNVSTIYLARGWTAPEDQVAYAKNLVDTAHANGMKVELLGAGGDDWWAPDATAGAIWAERHLSSGVAYDAVHIDVEPWVNGIDAGEMTNYVSALSKIKNVADTHNVDFNVDVHPLLNGQTDDNGNIMDQVISLSDEVTVMGYRNTATGIINYDAETLDRVTKAGKKMRYGVSVEPVDVVSCDFCTFIDAGQKSMSNTLNEVLAKNPSTSINGFAVQSSSYWKSLKN